FDSDGVADAPSGSTEGIVFVTEGTDNYLYVVANEGTDQWNRTKYLYKLSASDASVQTGYPKDLNNVVHDDLGGITYDGTDLILSAKSNSNIWRLTTTGDSASTQPNQGWPCCLSGWSNGLQGMAYHTGRSALYGVNGTELALIGSGWQNFDSTQNLKVSNSTMSGSVAGMVFAGDVLYLARTQTVLGVDTGYITAAAFSTSMTTQPQGLALSISTASYQGASVGEALWVVVDGTPKDRLIKLTESGGTWSEDTDFGSDSTKNGSAEMPDGNITGVTYLGDDGLYVVGGSDTYNPTLYQLNPTNGAVLDTYNLCDMMGGGGPMGGGGMGGGAMDMCGRPAGGLANNGSDRLIVFSSSENSFFFYNTSGQLQDNNPMGQGGGDAIDFIQSDSTYWTANDTEIQLWMNPGGDVFNIFPSDEYNMGAPNGSLDNIQGFVVCPSASVQGTSYACTEKDLFVGWHDGTDGYISMAVPPSPLTNTPQDLAYNATDNELYILVDGAGADAVVSVNPTTGAINTNSDGDQKFYTLSSEDTYGVAYIGSKVYVSQEEDCSGGSCHGPPASVITVLDADDFNFVEEFNLQSQHGRASGLDSDGTNLVATSQYGGPRVDHYNPSNGNPTKEMYFWHPTDFSWHVEDYSDVAYSTTTPMYFLSKYGKIYRAGEAGDIFEEWTITLDGVGLSSITGIDFVGNSLYIADSTEDKIVKALVPLPTINITNTPRAMASDGSRLYVAVDADPVDKILVMAVSTSTATVINSYDSPGTETDGLALHDGNLWVLTNDKMNIEEPGGFIKQKILPMIYQLATSTGAELDKGGPMMEMVPSQGVFPLTNTVGGLASDGTYLYTGTDGQAQNPGGGMQAEPGVLYRIEPDNYLSMNMMGHMISGPAIMKVEQFAGQRVLIESIQSLEVAANTLGFADDRRLIIAGSPYTNPVESNTISRLDLAAAYTGAGSSVVYDQYTLSNVDIRGMALIDKTLFMADADSNEIIGTALPENTGVEMSIVGTYATGLLVTNNSAEVSDTASYDMVRNTNVAVQLTSPSMNFVATGTSATISGRISDPAITNVSVGIQLPFTDFLDDPVAKDGTSAALWSAATTAGSGAVNWFIASGSNCPDCNGAAWRFGKSGESTYGEQGLRVAGTLTSDEVFPVTSGSTLTFDTAWQTEFIPDADIKLVQIAVVTTDLAGNNVVGTWQTIGQIVQFVDPMWMPEPQSKHPNFEWIQVPPLAFTPNQQHEVEVDLSSLAGSNVKIRFKFDTMDEWANEGGGWFVDDIKLSGSGTQTISIASTALDPPVVTTVNGSSTTMFRSFSTTFTLAEGSNTVVATAIQPYSPSLTGTAMANGFVDTLAPVITLYNVPANTGTVVQQLKGTLTEPTINQPGAIMQVTQNVTTVAGATSSVVIGKVTSEGEFTFGVSLQEGTNTFVASATDGGGLTSTAQLVTVADLTAPTATVTVVTVTSEGEAVAGDQYFVLIAATDTLSGVGTSTLVNSNQTIAPVTETPLILREMHGLNSVGAATTTHVTLAEVAAGTPIGLNTIPVTVQDLAGNQTTVNGSLNVVSARTNRNYFMFPGFNYMGLALIPDDGDANTTDDASLDRLMTQNVTDKVSQAFIDHLATSTVTLGDVIESTFAFNKAGNFVVHTPGPGAADTLTDLEPFQGMIVKTKETIATTTTVQVFKKIAVAGFTATQAVPIRVNIEGLFFRQGQLPPGKELRVGYNLVAPHVLTNTLFDTVYRGALIPKELAVSALSFERRVDASIDSMEISAAIFEGFSTNSIGSLLKPALSYWTFIADDPDDLRVNSLGDQLGPIITP
ncbi:MAG: hypothetical protein QF672_08095, partial [SAR202 cluster bacterium]|nr:hypothetical protein [SAR202 cluster bacterium]